MKRDVSATRADDLHALYDPAALPVTKDVEDHEPAEALAARGLALLYSAGSVTAPTLAVHVDEEPSPEARRGARYAARDRLLRVPSGRLVFTNALGMSSDAALRTTPLLVEPGDYLVEAFDVEWDSGFVDARIRERLTKEFGRRAAVAEWLTTGSCGLAAVTVVLAPVALLVAWRQLDAPDFRSFLLAELVTLAVLWLITLSAGRWPGMARVYEMHLLHQKDFAERVVVLRRLGPGVVAPTRGGAFGEGFLDGDPERPAPGT